MDYTQLINSPVFRGMNKEELEEILLQTGYKVKSYHAGSMISQAGEPVNSLMIVLSGVVKGEMVDYEGRVIKIEDIPATGALASAFLFGHKAIFPVNVITVTDVKLFIVEKSELLKLLMQNDRILTNFLDMISNRSQFLSEKIKFLNFKTIRAKLAFFILQKAGKNNNSIHLGSTQNELAEFFGVARPSVARALGDLEDEGYVMAKGKFIRILNKEGLANLTAE
jgi:CRP-like cAMP-binding protein